MKSTLFACALALMTLTGAARAADTCDMQATTKKLAGAAKTSFLKKCNADTATAMPTAAPAPAAAVTAPATANATATCDGRATDRKLAGAAKTSFLKKCNADGAGTVCDTQAADKKLHGAAKASFVKKCVADAGK